MFLAICLLAATVATPDDLSVLGVVVGTRADHSSALLRARGQTRVVGVGDAAFGGKVASIGAEVVTLDFDGTPVDVRVRGVKTAAPAAAPAPLKKTDGGPLEFSREEVQRRIASEAPRILAETAVVPATTDGKVTGMTLTRLPAGSSLLSDAGLQAGDVLTNINGTAVDGLPSLMSLWTKLQGQNSLQATVLRNGQPVTLNVNLH